MTRTVPTPIKSASHKRASDDPNRDRKGAVAGAPPRPYGDGAEYRSRLGITRARLSCCGIVPTYLALTATAAWAQHPEEGQVRRELERVFARSEFNPEPSVYLRQFLEWLFELFRRLNGLSSADPA